MAIGVHARRMPTGGVDYSAIPGFDEFKARYQSILKARGIFTEVKSFDAFCLESSPKKPKKITPSKADLELLERTKKPAYLRYYQDKINEITYSYFLLHNNAGCSTSEVPIILGDEKLRISIHELRNFGVICGDENGLSDRFKTDLLPTTPRGEGGILCEQTWDITKNDIAMIAAIQGEKDFHIFYQGTEIEYKDLWDEKNQRPRVLGREIIFLLEYGYKVVTNKSTGISFFPPKKENPKNVTYSDMLKLIDSFNDWDTFKTYLHENRIPYLDIQ